MEKLAVERTVWIAAPRERVWQAITDPEQVEKWFSPGTSWKLSALEVGGRLYAQGADAELYVHIIEALDPPHRIVLRSAPEPPATPEVTTYTLEEENNGTRLTLTYTGYELMPEELRRKRMDQDGMGFAMMLENLQSHIEGRSLPYPQGF
ncbi:MAG TPA: SRPBCC domain-containing protein [Anaerolineae bacterium]|nr:SRPBCC domain-containing protein [Anaerolineae bacterium]